MPVRPMTATPALQKSKIEIRPRATLAGKDQGGTKRCVYNYGTLALQDCAAGKVKRSRREDCESKKCEKMRFEATRLLKTKEVVLERTQERTQLSRDFWSTMAQIGGFWDARTSFAL